tara:strand:- start:15 stop:149 length:135 start_codon:yes stop_codon:yes gene_type:complete
MGDELIFSVMDKVFAIPFVMIGGDIADLYLGFAVVLFTIVLDVI